MIDLFSAGLYIGCICLIARYAARADPGCSEEAEFKGTLLLLENLTPEQNQQYNRFGYFDVVGSKTGKRYRIQSWDFGNVYELVAENQLGDMPLLRAEWRLGRGRLHARSEDYAREL